MNILDIHRTQSGFRAVVTTPKGEVHSRVFLREHIRAYHAWLAQFGPITPFHHR